MGKKMISYNDIYEFDLKLMKFVIDEYGEDSEEAWQLFYAAYIDPDSYPNDRGDFKSRGDIKCTADGLLSVKRIKEHEQGLNEKFIKTFKKYRRVPIVFFPEERGGINMLRASVFGDRIDHTLFDLKNYYEMKKKRIKRKNICKLKSAYEKTKTSRWLESFNDFTELVTWLDIREIFVDENDDVYDLEFSDGTKICNYLERYEREWTNNYYKNVQRKILEFEAKK